MEGSAAGQDGDGRQGDDLALGEDRLQALTHQVDGARIAVVRHDHRTIGDEKIHVAGRDGLFVLVADEAGRRKAQEFQPRAGRIGHFRQGPGNRVIDGVIRIVPPPGDGAGNDARSHKPGQIVHMAVGVVVQQAVAEPQHLARAQ